MKELTITGGYQPPSPSRAFRKIPLRSRASRRGERSIKIPGNPRLQRQGYESGYEDHVSLLLRARPDFKDIREQPEPVLYLDQHGKERVHNFDFLYTSSTDIRSAIAVRPEKRVSTTYRKTLGLIAAQLPASFADQVVLITDHHFCKNRVRDIERYFGFHDFEDFEGDDCLYHYLSDGFVAGTVEKIVTDLAIGTRGLSAVFRAVMAGVLRKRSRYPLGYSSIVLAGGSL